MAPQAWAMLNATGVGITEHRARLLDTLKMLGDVNGETLTFEYISSYPWESDGGTPKETPTSDTDVWRLDRRLMIAAVKWRWKKEKGVDDWQADVQQYQRYLGLLRGRDGGAKALQFGDASRCPPEPYTPLWVV